MNKKKRKYAYKGEYTCTISISPEHKGAIREISGKKSMAGKLKEIINFYLEKKGFSKLVKK